MASRIENYLGFPAGLSGVELASRALAAGRQVRRQHRGPAGGRRAAAGRAHAMSSPSMMARRSRAAASSSRLGARYRKLGVPGEAELEGANVYYAATEVEAQVCQGQDVAVVGGGNSAGQAALFLAERAKTVYLVARCEDLGEDMSRYLVDRILSHVQIEVLIQTYVRELVGEGELVGITRRAQARRAERRDDRRRGALHLHRRRRADGLVGGDAALDEKGFILTGPRGQDRPGLAGGQPRPVPVRGESAGGLCRRRRPQRRDPARGLRGRRRIDGGAPLSRLPGGEPAAFEGGGGGGRRTAQGGRVVGVRGREAGDERWKDGKTARTRIDR